MYIPNRIHFNRINSRISLAEAIERANGTDVIYIGKDKNSDIDKDKPIIEVSGAQSAFPHNNYSNFKEIDDYNEIKDFLKDEVISYLFHKRIAIILITIASILIILNHYIFNCDFLISVVIALSFYSIWYSVLVFKNNLRKYHIGKTSQDGIILMRLNKINLKYDVLEKPFDTYTFRNAYSYESYRFCKDFTGIVELYNISNISIKKFKEFIS